MCEVRLLCSPCTAPVHAGTLHAGSMLLVLRVVSAVVERQANSENVILSGRIRARLIHAQRSEHHAHLRQGSICLILDCSGLLMELANGMSCVPSEIGTWESAANGRQIS